MTVASVHLRTSNQVNYVCAEGGGGAEVNATRTQALEWETFSLISFDGSSTPFTSGQKVHLRASNGMYLCAEGGGGGQINANRPWAKEWETYTLEKRDGGALKDGDEVSFRTYDGKHYLTAELGGGGTLTASAPSAEAFSTFTLTLISTPTRIRLAIDLVSVYCSNTEDVTGADEFYLLGSAIADNGSSRAVITSPVSINDRQTRGFPPDQSRIFDGELLPTESVALLLQSYDEDVAHDWRNRPKWVNDVGGKVAGTVGAGAATALVSNPIGWGVLAATVIGAAAAGGLILALAGDKDDRLGELRDIIPATGPGFEDRNWSFRQSGWYSGWNYTVHYRISRYKA